MELRSAGAILLMAAACVGCEGGLLASPVRSPQARPDGGLDASPQLDAGIGFDGSTTTDAATEDGGMTADCDCPASSVGPWGACGYADSCATTATRQRQVTDFSCVNNMCMGRTRTDVDTCSRNTQGQSCGASSCGGWTACYFADACAISGTRQRQCAMPMCTAGVCGGNNFTQTETCQRPEPSGCETSDEVTRVCSRWNADLTASSSEGSWSGNVNACNPGDNAVGRTNALRLVNLYRWFADLPPVSTDATKNQKAQQCALMMHANGTLSHSPPQSWDCYTPGGAQAAGSSNISGGRGVQSVHNYMIDWGNPTTIGHRRWILSNSLGPIGLGTTNAMSCMWVFGSGNAGKAWTAFPTPGVFPFEATRVGPTSVDDTGWTVQSDAINLANASVRVTENGVDRPVSVVQLAGNYGARWAIRFNPNGWSSQPGKTYHVRVSGVSPVIEYDVQFERCQ